MVNEDSSVNSGLQVMWGAEHRDKDGNLICRMASVNPPEPPKCSRPSCLAKYVWASMVYAMVSIYHTKRVAYAEANRGKEILERYRTGEPSPTTMWGAIHANLKLQCPLCRRYNVDPLLRR
uniref:Uncharacterized protein n=1 Tax=viral metagenome TaxID=1070528 RepID=A0A6H1ZPW6_9ZZZZ